MIKDGEARTRMRKFPIASTLTVDIAALPPTAGAQMFAPGSTVRQLIPAENSSLPFFSAFTSCKMTSDDVTLTVGICSNGI